jgi:integrase
MMALSTGMRRGELLGLRWSEVDLDRGLARLIDTKNGEARAVTLTPTVRARLKDRKPKTGLVFHAPGEPDRPLDPRGAFETACERAGLTDFVWHDLRHTTASYLAMSGATLAEIAAVLGHKTLAMVKRYSHLSDDHVSGVIERMDQRWLS